MRSKCLVNWFLVASLNQLNISWWKIQSLKMIFDPPASFKGIKTSCCGQLIQLFKGFWKSRKIPGLYFWESRDQDFEKIPGSQDIPGSRRSLVMGPLALKLKTLSPSSLLAALHFYTSILILTLILIRMWNDVHRPNNDNYLTHADYDNDSSRSSNADWTRRLGSREATESGDWLSARGCRGSFDH